jgi:hypothetical protein
MMRSQLLPKYKAHIHKHILFTKVSFSFFFQVTDNNTLDHLDDNVDKHIDTYTKTAYAQFKRVIEILNAR